MNTLDIKVSSYFSNTNFPTHFNVDLSVANDELAFAFTRTSWSFACVLGSLDIPNSIYPDFATAEAHFLPDYTGVIVDTVNTTMGTTYVLGNVYHFMNKLEYDTFSAKQNVIPIADNISSAATNAVTNAPINLNVVTTLLGTLVGEVNNANNRANVLAVHYNDLANRFNTLISHLQTQGLQSDR